MSQPEKILVVGGTGRVGGELVRLLVEDKAPTRVLVRSEGAAAAMPAGVETIVGELGAKRTVHDAARGTSHIFVAIADCPEQPRLEGNLIDSAVRCRVKRFVKVSAFAAGLEPPPGYGRVQAAIERELTRTELSWTILRPYMYMQNILALAGPIRRAGLLPLPLGRCHVAMIDARDVARAARHVLYSGGHGEQIYDLTGPAALDGRECARVLAAMLSRRVRYLPVPERLSAMLMRWQGTDPWNIEMRTQLFEMLRSNGEAQPNGTFQRLTETQPRSFGDFVSDHRNQLS